jgi:hypothetical protein
MKKVAKPAHAAIGTLGKRERLPLMEKVVAGAASELRCALACLKVVLPMMIAVETHHSVTQVNVILVKNVTFVTTESMAPADRAGMASPPWKMAPAVNLMKVDNFVCRTAIAKVTHHSATNIIATLAQSAISATMVLTEPVDLVEMGSQPWKTDHVN